MTQQSKPAAAIADLHLRVGWWSLLAFLSLGIVIEAMHGFKIGYYLDVRNETRRLMWTLAHAHGTLLSMLNIIFALTARTVAGGRRAPSVFASRCMLGALVLLPIGFFLGGVFIHGGDPGIGIVLVPPGALLLLLGVWSMARASGRGGGSDAAGGDG